MNKILTVLFGISILFLPSAVLAETVYPLAPIGKHSGEISPIAYSIEYTGTLGVTTASAAGITYAPYGYYPTFEPTILPERYFGDYPLYFADGPFAFTIHLKNIGKRTYRNLLVITAQEFLNTNGDAGELFPGNAAHNWHVEKLGPGEQVALSGEMILPSFGSSGIDQTHLQILHWGEEGRTSDFLGAGRILLDAPQAGLWCPISE